MSNFLAIDQGTTSSRAIVFNSQLNTITDSQQEYSLSYPNDGWVEADPADILNTVRETVSDVLKKENVITACGITNQREPIARRLITRRWPRRRRATPRASSPPPQPRLTP